MVRILSDQLADVQNRLSKREEAVKDLNEKRIQMQVKLDKYQKSHEMAQALRKYVDELQNASAHQNKAMEEMRVQLASQMDMVK
jgi:hypothetical protein